MQITIVIEETPEDFLDANQEIIAQFPIETQDTIEIMAQRNLGHLIKVLPMLLRERNEFVSEAERLEHREHWLSNNNRKRIIIQS